MSGMNWLWILFTLFDSVSGSYCYYYIYDSGYGSGTYCSNNCCNYNTYNPCCSYSYDSYSSYLTTYTISAAAIAGIVIGCLIAAGVVIAIIVCVCLAQRRNSRPYGGQVFQTGQHGGQVIQTGQPVISYVPATNTSNMQPQGMQGGYSNNGYMISPSYYTGNVAQPPPTLNTATQSSGQAD